MYNFFLRIKSKIFCWLNFENRDIKYKLGEDNTNMQTEKKLHGMVLASLVAILSVVIFGLRF